MLQMRAVVVELQGDEAIVQPLNGGGCGHCSSAGGCGSGNLTKLFCANQPRQFGVRNEIRARVGDLVQISLPDGELLRGAMKVYLLPLALLLFGGFVGAGLAAEDVQDAAAAAGAVAGLLFGFALARLFPSNHSKAVATSIVTPSSAS